MKFKRSDNETVAKPKVRATITFMRGGRVPQDVIVEHEIDTEELESTEQLTRLNLGAVKVPKGTKQINVVVWDEDGRERCR